MELDLNINIKGAIEEGFARRIGKIILEAIRAFEELNKDIDFRRMHRIIVTSDYAGELEALSLNPQSTEPRYTNEEYAIGIAQVRTIPRDGSFEFVPVINAAIAASLVQDNEEGYNSDPFRNTLHLLHHELCHVHDNNKKLDAISNMYPDDPKDEYLLPIADKCWTEYIANILSSDTATLDSIGMVCENFIDAVKRTKDEIDNEICEYRLHHDLDSYIAIFQRHGHFLVKSAAYVMGFMDGLETSLEKLSAEASECLKGSYFENTWNKMHDALRNMRKLYPGQWKDLSAYDELRDVLDSYYADMGMILSVTSDGQLYMDIPFTL
jgi:hypothetical protein